MSEKVVDFSELLGLVIRNIIINQGDGSDEIQIITNRGRKFLMYHIQDCCESVWIEDICGNVGDVIAQEITKAECVVKIKDEGCDSETWTFYKLDTRNGGITIRWCGSSNGYYSESVDFVEVTS